MTETTMKQEVSIARWPWWARLALLALPCILLLIVGEIAGRLLERYAGYLPRRAARHAERNASLRTALIPNARFASGPFHVTVNNLGFRGAEIAVPKPHGTF